MNTPPNTLLAERLERVVGMRPTRLSSLTGGCVAEVTRACFGDGTCVVVKSSASGGLECEGWMLGYLALHSSLPVPDVIYSDDDLLVIEYIDNQSGSLGTPAQTHAAELLASLHSVSSAHYGLERDTVIGGLHQPNPPTRNWIDFFRDQRLLYMSRRGRDGGVLGAASVARLEKLCSRLDQWIGASGVPSLIHGDVWGGNVLSRGDTIAAFVDPAIYFADAEIELAFSTLFSTFDDAFFRRYAELRPISPGFFELRRDIYNLYPLLVHAILFGPSYARSVDAITRRLVG